MALVDLDKVINVTGGGSTTIYPDTPYPVLNYSIGLFNKDNAWDTDSAGWFGLLGSSVNQINAQNNSFNSQYSIATKSGVSALSQRVKSYAFATDINTIDAGVIRAAFYYSPYSRITLDEVNNRILDSIGQNVLLPVNANRRTFIVTSGGNKFFVLVDRNSNEIISYSLDTNLKIVSQVSSLTITDPTSDSGFGITNRQIDIVGINGNRIFVVKSANTGGQATFNCGCQVTLSGYIYNISSSGVITSINENVKFVNFFQTNGMGSIGFNEETNATSSYFTNNTGHYVVASSFRAQAGGGFARSTVLRQYITIDLNNVSTFTFTNQRQDVINTGNPASYYPNTQGNLTGGYDGIRYLFVTGEGSNQIWEVTPANFVNTGSNYFTTYTNFARYRNSIGKLTSSVANTYINNNNIVINNAVVGGILTNLATQNAFLVFEPNGIDEQDATSIFRGLYLNTNAFEFTVNADSLSISVNGIITQTIAFGILSNTINQTADQFVSFNNFSLANPIATPDIELTLSTTNVNARDIKIGFGLTGGTYASPTGTNDASGTVSSPWTIGVNGSRIDLTLST